LTLALRAAQDRGLLSEADLAGEVTNLRALPGLIAQSLTTSDKIETIANKLAEAQDILFLGRGQMYPLALEGALKLKEISYIHAEGYASGELKHGPIALIDRNVPVVVMAPEDALFEKTVSNMQEVMARGGQIVLITNRSGAKIASDGATAVLEMPDVADLLAPILYAIPAQLLAYHTAVAKGTDVDQPRNLAKSVTVE
jgi:glucosamine--fructose-6-phosphate aminotransferase (isomerizing)